MNYVMDSETAKGMIIAARKALGAMDSIECIGKSYECQDCVFGFIEYGIHSKRAGSAVRCMYDVLRDNL